MNNLLQKYQKLDSASKKVVDKLVEFLSEKKAKKIIPKTKIDYAKKILKVSVWSEGDLKNIGSKNTDNWQISQW